MRTNEQGLLDGAACLEAALAYLGVGWCPIPLCPPDHIGVRKEHAKSCPEKSHGKAPLVVGWPHFEQLPTEAEVRGWWKTWPNANVGVVMGRLSGLVGLDIDDEAGELLLAEWSAEGMPVAGAFVTPGGGRRVLFRVPQGGGYRIRRQRAGDHQELRILAEGSQTVAPPSRHRTGGLYVWES